jgi:multicomponent Na+:H+ antiporter subunit B
MTTFSIILSTSARYMLPLLLLFSFFLLLRGHYNPGGGFVGGLMASAAFTVFAFGYGVQRSRELLRIEPRTLMGVGLLVAVVSGLPGVLIGDPFMSGLWFVYEIPAVGKVGTPLIFDFGVYLVVLGVVLTIIFALDDSAQTEDKGEA